MLLFTDACIVPALGPISLQDTMQSKSTLKMCMLLFLCYQLYPSNFAHIPSATSSTYKNMVIQLRICFKLQLSHNNEL